jgi:hypothetical protein
MTFRITPNIPIPARKRESKFPLRQMEIGDSFEVGAKFAGVDGKIIYQAIQNFKKRVPSMRFTARKVNKSYRVWRLK